MSKAWRMTVRQTGGPDVLEREDFDPPAPLAGEILVRNRAIGLNFIDIYHRTGFYPLPLPMTLGREGSGIVEAIGEGVEGIAPGDQVVYFGKHGTYATHAVADAALAFPLPAGLDHEAAAASLLKGLTAWMLIERCARVEAGQHVLVHAAAGGVGSIAVQWLKAMDAKVIAHSGTPEKAAIARRLGADVSLHGALDALAHSVREATGGRGVHAVLDGVGQDSWEPSLASVAKRGIIVSYGNASGPVPPISLLALGKAGSIFVTRPTVFDWIERPEDRKAGWSRLSDMLVSGKVKIEIGQYFALDKAADAHRALEGRQTTGATILIP